MNKRLTFRVQKFAGRTEQTFARAYLMSPGYVPGAGHQNAEVRFHISTYHYWIDYS